MPITRGIEMNDLPEALKKTPTAIQATFGFALCALAAFIGINAFTLAQGDLVTALIILLLSGIYAILGLPSLVEGVLTMNAEYEERKRLVQQPKK